MKSNIKENPFKAGTFVRVTKRVGIKPTEPGHVALGTPYIGALDFDLKEGGGISLGMAQLGSGEAGPSLHWLRTSPISTISITEDKAVVQTQNSTYEVEKLSVPYKLQPGDLHP